MSITPGPEAAQNVLEAPGSVRVHDFEASTEREKNREGDRQKEKKENEEKEEEEKRRGEKERKRT